jgi:oligoendopeptidase F
VIKFTTKRKNQQIELKKLITACKIILKMEETSNIQTPSSKAIQWDLTNIIPENQFDLIYQQIEKKIEDFKQFKQKLTPNIPIEDFQLILEADDSISKQFNIISSYVSLKLASNIKDAKARTMQNKLDSLSIKIHDASLFFSHWLKGLPSKDLEVLDDENAKRLFNETKNYKFSLEYLRKAAKHTLTESEEQIMHRKDTTGIDVITELYTMITNDFEYNFHVKDQDSIIIKNQQELLKYVHSNNPDERKAAYNALFTPYKEHKDKLFLIYTAVAKDWADEAKLRKYENSIDMRNMANKVSKEAIDTLLEVCRNNKELFQNFFKLKAKKLGIEKLRRYDLYSPLHIKEPTKTFAEAKQIVLDSFDSFWPDFSQKAKTIIEKNHLDSHPKENKRGGAFCMSISSEIAPFVMTNFDGTNRAVSTLAHELGHAVHDLHTSHLPYSVSHAPLPLCETASTFAEMVVFEKLLSTAESSEEKQSLLMEKIASSYATIIRQNYFILFEIQAHKMLQAGASQEELNNAYFKLLQDQFGDSVELDEDFAYEWSYIPHIFHSPFYCYAYNFGELLSLSLYAMYKQEGANTFLPKLEKILKAGGSEDPAMLLNSIGIDITDKNFWQGAFTIVKNWVNQLE